MYYHKHVYQAAVTSVRLGYKNQLGDYKVRKRIASLKIPVSELRELLVSFGFYCAFSISQNVLMYQNRPIVFFEKEPVSAE